MLSLARRVRLAFTLLELIVVLTVVGILAAVAVPTFNTVKENSAVRSAATMAATIGRDADAVADSQGISFGAALAIAVDEHNDAATNDFAVLDDNGDGTFSSSVTVGSYSVGCTWSPGAGLAYSTVTCVNGGAPVLTAPGAPTIVSITPGNGQLSVAFTAPVSNGGSAIIDYEYALDGGSWVSSGATVSPVIITGLTNGVSYGVELRAVNSVGAGSSPSPESATPSSPITPPGAPTVTTVNHDDGQLSLVFTAPTSNGGSAITDYEYALDGGSWVSAASTTSPVVITGLTNGVQYSVQLRAVNSAGSGTPSPAALGTPAPWSWTILGADLPGEAASDLFGKAVAVSTDGSTLASGGSQNDGSASDAGHMRVFTWNGSSWAQLGSDIDGEAAGDGLGASVALSSDGLVLAAGAQGNDGGGSNAGHVRVYDWNGSDWVQRGSDIDGEASNDLSGKSVALAADGDTVAIGAHNNDGGGSNAGHVRVYDWNGSAWVKRGSDIDGEAASDQLGYAVALSADGLVLSAGANQNDGGGSNAGHVRVYDWNGSAWVKRGADIDGEAAGDGLGSSVSLSADGTALAAGAITNDGTGTDAGHVRVYDWNGSSWVQRGADIDGEAAGDYFGMAVSLSTDGTVLAVGASRNDGNGANSGHARVLAWSGSAWVQRGSDMNGKAAGDEYGYSLQLSGDGTRLVAGGYRNASSKGYVRSYQWQ